MRRLRVVAVLGAFSLLLARTGRAGGFELLEARASSEEEQSVELRFSEPLRAGQNLNGLVRLEPGRCSARIEGSVLRVFPQPRLAGPVTLRLAPGLQSERGERLGKSVQRELVFAARKPRVRFGQAGVILPATGTVRVPFEALNARSVQVTAFRVFANDVGQFLQANKLDGTRELGRVGRYLWRRKIVLPDPAPEQWQRYDLDATELLKSGPGGLYRLTLSISRADSAYACPGGAAAPAQGEAPPASAEGLDAREASAWDGAEEQAPWSRRAGEGAGDPCQDAYYRSGAGVSESRNFLASDIGLIAKLGAGPRLRVAAVRLSTAKPLEGVELRAMNFQNQPIGSAATGKDGFAELELGGKAFYLEAKKGRDRGYLKLSDGGALPVSHFDVGGERPEDGLKGFVFGERGVWRPGDDIHLTLMLEDKEARLPAGHPAVLRLYNPKDQLMDTQVQNRPVGGFYAFVLKTPEDAPTGVWHAKVALGGREFLKDLRIETVLPNRLKVELDPGGEVLVASGPLRAALSSQWLHGAKASGLKAQVTLRLAPAAAGFERFADYAWEDPTRELRSREPSTVFEGALDAGGRATFYYSVEPESPPPGVLSAQFETRVFEPGGAFSSSQKTAVLHPYPSYVGLKLPQGDAARGLLRTDRPQTLELASLDAEGRPVSLPKVKVALYKLDWRWWWDKGAGQAEFAKGQGAVPIREDGVATADGRGEWSFELKYPDWGRYLVRACDERGGHCSGRVFYADWPGYAGHAQEQSGPAADALALSFDRPSRQVGETAVLSLPEADQGRLLLSLETGSRVLSQRWLTASKATTQVRIPVTADMSPTVYAHVTLVQPQNGKANDRPIRLYGVAPLSVLDPGTVLEPRLRTAQEWRPASSAEVTVSEGRGRAMDYMLMVVDEGLLGLTGHATPDPHARFYAKEALGVSTWDLYDHVVGGYGARLERLLALGGSDAGGEAARAPAARRFPPVVRVLGPFTLEAGASAVHKVELPAYVGALRVMAVAGRRGAYGSAERSVPVRRPLMVQATLPRVMGPDEELSVPVTAFVMKEGIADVEAVLTASGPFTLTGPRRQKLSFERPGEQLAYFSVRSGERLGPGLLTAAARAGSESATEETRLTVRSPNPPTTEHEDLVVEPHALVRRTLTPHGLPGSNKVVLTASALPPFNLEPRLQHLIQYPYGCAEQTTSSVFPQLALPRLMRLPEDKRAGVDANIAAGIQRLALFQTPSGGFDYWEGSVQPNEWVTDYVGHFLLEAEKAGYAVPAAMKTPWLDWQGRRARDWEPAGADAALLQAYRLYTLALAGKPELGAMNRLREAALGDVASWLLASAYDLAGVRDAAAELARSAGLSPQGSRLGECLSTELRDRSIILDALARRKDFARGRPLAEAVAARLRSSEPLSTHDSAFALLAMADYYGGGAGEASLRYQYAVGSGRDVQAASDKPVDSRELTGFPDAGAELRIYNPGERRLFVTVSVHGVPKAGLERSYAHGLELSAEYQDPDGRPLEVAELPQGAEVLSLVRVRNGTGRDLENIALTQLAPSGWEIHNPRWGRSEDSRPEGLDYQDVRDDRIYSFFALKAGETRTVRGRFTAAYLGKYYLPALYAEAMYEPAVNGAAAGRRVAVSAR